MNTPMRCLALLLLSCTTAACTLIFDADPQCSTDLECGTGNVCRDRLCVSNAPDASVPSTVIPNIAEDRGTWAGFGCSLSWWANATAGTSFESTYENALFGDQDVTLLSATIPGLDLNFVRYDVGGGGRAGDVGAGTGAVVLPASVPWYKDIEGFWTNASITDVSVPAGWDFTRDARQRAVLTEAVARGVDTVELYSTSPMWWMTSNRSAAGGTLLEAQRGTFATYLLAVADHANASWGITAGTLAPFYQPSSGLFSHPASEQGINLTIADQVEILRVLRNTLDDDASSTGLAGPDELTFGQSEATFGNLQNSNVMRGAASVSADALLDTINVQSSDAVANERIAFRNVIGERSVAVSAYTDGDPNGFVLARTIVADMNVLHPRSWSYFQPIVSSSDSAHGLIAASFGTSASDPQRGTPVSIQNKYFVMAHFSRFIRPGYKIIGSNDPSTIVAFDATGGRLIFITLNDSLARTVTYDLSGIPMVGTNASVTATTADGSKRFFTSTRSLSSQRLEVPMDSMAIYSIVITGVSM